MHFLGNFGGSAPSGSYGAPQSGGFPSSSSPSSSGGFNQQQQQNGFNQNNGYPGSNQPGQSGNFIQHRQSVSKPNHKRQTRATMHICAEKILIELAHWPPISVEQVRLVRQAANMEHHRPVDSDRKVDLVSCRRHTCLR